MGLVLWIDQNTFATSLIERVFKKHGLGFYSLASAKDFAYLVDDLKPEVIVLDFSTATKDLEILRKEYLESSILQQSAFIFLDGHEGLEFIQNNRGQIQRPIDPFKIPALLQKMLGKLI